MRGAILCTSFIFVTGAIGSLWATQGSYTWISNKVTLQAATSVPNAAELGVAPPPFKCKGSASRLYTKKARAAKVDADYRLDIVIDPLGKPVYIQVTSDYLGYGVEQSAVHYFRQCRYKPIVHPQSGQAISAKVTQNIRLKMK